MNDDSMRRAALAAALSTLNRGAGEWLLAAEHDDFAECVGEPLAIAALATFGVPEADSLSSPLPREMRATLRCAIETAQMELERRGFDPALAPEAPDLHLFALATSCDKTSEHWGCVGGFWLGTSGWRWDPCLWFADSHLAYPAGTLLVGLADSSREQLAFAGVAPRFFDRPGELSARMGRTVARMFADFPRRMRAIHAPAENHASSDSNESQWGAQEHGSTTHQGSHFGGPHRGHFGPAEQRRSSSRRIPLADGFGA